MIFMNRPMRLIVGQYIRVTVVVIVVTFMIYLSVRVTIAVTNYIIRYNHS